MARWIGTGALALAWVTFAAAQAPVATPAPPAEPRIGEVMTFRTAGQPERRVRVVNVVGTAETDGLADVQDLGTGAKYSVPLKVVAMMARGSTTEPADAPAAKPTSPSAASGSASGLPGVAQTLPTAPPTGANGWPKSSPTPKTPAAAPSALWRSGEARAALPPPTNVRSLMRPDTPPAEPSRVPVVAAKFAPTQSPPPTFTLPQRPKMESRAVAYAAPAARPVVTAEPSTPAPPTVVAASEYRPAVASQPTEIRPPTGPIAAPEYVVVPVLEYTAEAPAPVALPDRFGPPPVTPLAEPQFTAAPPVAAPTPVPVTPPAPPAPLPTPVVAASRVAPPADPVPVAGIPAQMLDEVQPLVNDLFQALRPSLRERAATGLAEGRYGSRPEVKATLAQAALTDPAPTVRAHCIAQLARLGYHEPSYLGYLDACAESGHAVVKQAAAAAIAKLASRN